MFDLRLIYKTIAWHQTQTERKPGESVGIFITLPTLIAKQFPSDGKVEIDSSPPHVTVLQCGSIPSDKFEEKLKEVISKVCLNTKSFKVSLSKPKEFINDKNQTIVHSPIKSKKLFDFHNLLKKALLFTQLPVDNKFPEFKPHCTIEYVNEGENSKYENIIPQGEWEVESIWLWGLSEPYLFMLEK